MLESANTHVDLPGVWRAAPGTFTATAAPLTYSPTGMVWYGITPQSATDSHDLPSPAVAVRNLTEQVRVTHLCTIMSRMHHRRAGYPFGSIVDCAMVRAHTSFGPPPPPGITHTHARSLAPHARRKFEFVVVRLCTAADSVQEACQFDSSFH